MAYSQDEITALERAIARGVTEVRRGDESVRYRSLEEMRQTLAHMRAAGPGQGPKLRQMTPRTSRGL